MRAKKSRQWRIINRIKIVATGVTAKTESKGVNTLHLLCTYVLRF